MHHVVSKSNVADIVTKHWGHSSVYNLLNPVFGHEGDTDELYEDDSPEALSEQYKEPKWNVIWNLFVLYFNICPYPWWEYILIDLLNKVTTHSLTQMGSVKYHNIVCLFGT